MTGILVVGSLTLLASFLCSLFEAALYAITPSQVEVLKAAGVPGSRRLARLRDDVEAPIAAILTVNTIAHTVGATWCGALAATEFGSNAVGVFAAVFTVLVLVLTEILPKSIGVRFASTLGPWIVWPLQLMIWSVWPVVWVAQKFMRLLTGAGHNAAPSEDEVVLFSGLAAKGGTVRPEEHRWIKNALRLDRVTANDLRTPRTVVESLPADTPITELSELAERWKHSRLPITEGDNIDKILGLVHRRAVFDAALAGNKDLVLSDLMAPMMFVPMNMPAHDLLDLFLEKRQHMAAVVSEYGGLQGLVTLEDVLECLLGAEIVDEHDEVEDMQAHARDRNRGRSLSEPSDDDEDAEPAPADPDDAPEA